MYVKSYHTPLSDGGHKWDITLFCSNEANTIAHVDINPKSRGSKVVPNDAKPAPTAYTMTYISSSKFEDLPLKFVTVITFKSRNNKTRKKIIRVNEPINEKMVLPPPPPKKKKRVLCSVFRSKKNSISEKDDAPQNCCCTIM
ncbi:5653_t:CDS:2 [Dentiscutata heterogama]|uniref:5653_t:CDS:1 n=1 Tax=Dentiscutata heterogama TaxID=1316150 RepID=A0ACA9M9J4_9GLOM|nr:5653_t:CDS:2 [Dentiscutata heterogama]